MNRITCKIWGCAVGQDPACVRCGAFIYDDFLQEGWVAPIVRIYDRIATILYWTTNRCQECGKRMWFTHSPVCSDKCWETWIPF